MCSKPKFCLKIVLTNIRVRELFSKKPKIFILVRIIELDADLDYFRQIAVTENTFLNLDESMFW